MRVFLESELISGETSKNFSRWNRHCVLCRHPESNLIRFPIQTQPYEITDSTIKTRAKSKQNKNQKSPDLGITPLDMIWCTVRGLQIFPSYFTFRIIAKLEFELHQGVTATTYAF